MIFVAPFSYDFEIFLCLVLGGSLFLSLHVSSAHHCFCATDLYMLTAEPSSWLRVSAHTLTRQIFTHTIVHGRWALTQRPINNNAGHSTTRTHAHTRQSRSSTDRRAQESLYTHTHTRERAFAHMRSGEKREVKRTHTHTYHSVRYGDSWKAGQQIFDYATPI